MPALALLLATGGAWTLRNRVQLGVWAPIKSNGAYEAWQAQMTTADGIPDYATFLRHPFLDGGPRARYVAEGERAFVARHGAAFWADVRKTSGGVRLTRIATRNQRLGVAEAQPVFAAGANDRVVFVGVAGSGGARNHR